MDGEIQPKNKVLVVIIGPPRSGKSKLAHDIQEAMSTEASVEETRVFQTNDWDAFDQIQRITDKAMVES